MHWLDARAATTRHRENAYTIAHARARFRVDLNPNRLGFRAWARRTYSPAASTGKLAALVARKDPCCPT
jgi:hypothetical protein